MSNKPKKKVSNIMLVLICTMIIIYTAADFALQYFAHIEVSPTLTTAWFAFWGTELVVYPVLSIAGIYLTYLISVKIKELKQKTNDDNAKKYLDMLNETIAAAVLATTQTYVDALKGKNAFDADAQKVAFQMSYDAVMATLTDEAKLYLTTVVGDLESYITTRIEYNVNRSK